MRCIDYVDKLRKQGWKVAGLEGNNLILSRNGQLQTIDLRFDTSAKAAGNGVGTSWTTPGNIVSSNDQYADYSIPKNAISNFLYAYTFGFVVSGAITNIYIKIERHSDTANMIADYNIQIGLYGGSYYTNKADTITLWPNSDAVKIYSFSPTDWGWAGITAANINDANFGIAFKAKNTDADAAYHAYIDYIEITVTYTPAAGPANLKTFNGLEKASVKTINGLAIASVKTWNGLG